MASLSEGIELYPGERIIYQASPSKLKLADDVLTLFGVLVVVAGVKIAADKLEFMLDASIYLALAGIGILYALLRSMKDLIYIFTTRIVVTDKRVISKSGLMLVDAKSTPLERINNVRAKRSIFGRISFFDFGDVEITTATADESDNHSYTFISHPYELARIVNESVETKIRDTQVRGMQEAYWQQMRQQVGDTTIGADGGQRYEMRGL